MRNKLFIHNIIIEHSDNNNLFKDKCTSLMSQSEELFLQTSRAPAVMRRAYP